MVSYHMGIGNLQQVLGAYGDDDASYAQLFFDTAPNQHPRAYRLLTGLGDDSKTYLWRVLASHEVMRLYRDDRARLERLAELHAGADSGELVLHPPDRDGGVPDRGRRRRRPTTTASCARSPTSPPATGCGPRGDELAGCARGLRARRLHRPGRAQGLRHEARRSP